MVYNVILMETIGISVMVSIRLLLFFFSRGAIGIIVNTSFIIGNWTASQVYLQF